MIDLHSHILPGIDDGATSVDASMEMARLWIEDGVTTVACTPHILPGLYNNTGPQIIQAIDGLQIALALKGLDLKLVAGADNYMVADFIPGLRNGRLLTLAGSRYVLVEPPHNICPPRLEYFFFDISTAGYVPILTHPERLTWIESNYPRVVDLAQKGVWMQITAGSLTGAFGKRPRYWAERMLDEGLVSILASDAHNVKGRLPNMRQGFEAVLRLKGEGEAVRLTTTQPQRVLDDALPNGASSRRDVALDASV